MDEAAQFAELAPALRHTYAESLAARRAGEGRPPARRNGVAVTHVHKWNCRVLGAWVEQDEFDLELWKPAKNNWRDTIVDRIVSSGQPSDACNWK
jgi:hypothetical protein